MQELKIEELMTRAGGSGSCGRDKGGNGHCGHSHAPKKSRGGRCS